MYAIITAILVATAPGMPPDNVGAFFTDTGPELCRTVAAEMNRTGTETLYVCEVNNG